MMRGITLIEVLVYMTLLSLLLIGTYTMSSAITNTTERIHTETRILGEGIFISDLLRDAVTDNRVVHTGHDSLVLSDGRAFRRSGDVLWYDYGSTSQQLTYPPVSLSSLTSSIVYPPAAPSYLELTFTLSAHGIQRSFISLLYP